MSNQPPPTQAQWQAENPDFLNEAIDLVLTEGFGNRDVAVFYRTDLGARYLMFTTVPPEHRKIAAALSTLGVAMNVFLDDIADQHQNSTLIDGAKAMMLDGKAVPHDGLTPLNRMWTNYWKHISTSPNFSVFEDLLMGEWGNLLNAMSYSILVNSNAPIDYSLNNSIQNLAPNMHHVIKHVVDMCYSPGWNSSLTPPAMELMREAQIVTRIGNWVKSWRQELSVNRDITSGVFAVTSDWNIFTRDELLDINIPADEIIRKIESYRDPQSERNPENYLLALADTYIQEIRETPDYDAFINREQYAAALKQVLQDQADGKDEKR